MAHANIFLGHMTIVAALQLSITSSENLEMIHYNLSAASQSIHLVSKV